MRAELVYLTPESMRTGYDVDHTEDLVYERPVAVDVAWVQTVGEPGRMDRMATLELIFDIFNRHESPTQHEAMDRLGLRSLSVGDVVIFGDEAYRCLPAGWTAVVRPLRYAGASDG